MVVIFIIIVLQWRMPLIIAPPTTPPSVCFYAVYNNITSATHPCVNKEREKKHKVMPDSDLCKKELVTKHM